MDLDKLMDYYRSCPSYGGITFTMGGSIGAAPQGAFREGFPLHERQREGDVVVPAGITIVLHGGAGLNQGHGPDGSYTQMCVPSAGGSTTTYRYRYRDLEIQLRGPLTARTVLRVFSGHVAAECTRNQLLTNFLTGNDDGLEKLDDTRGDGDQDAAAAASAGSASQGSSGSAAPWRPPHWRSITEEERTPFLNYEPRMQRVRVAAPVLEFTPDPLEGVPIEKLILACDVCSTCALVGFEPITNAAAPSGGPVTHHYKAIWSEPFC